MAKNIDIGGRLHSVATEHIVAGANEIQDDTLNKTQAQINEDVNNTLEIHDSAIEGLNSQNYVSVDAFSELPELGSVNTVYRVGSWDGEQVDTTKYAEYAWINTGIDQGNYVLLDVKNYGIDGEPTEGSNNLVKSGGVYEKISQLDQEVKENKDEYDAEINGTEGTRAVAFTPIYNRVLQPTTVDILTNWAITDYIDISQMWKVRVVATQFPGAPYVSVQMYDVNKTIQQSFVNISTDTTITNDGWYYMRVSFRYSNDGTLSIEEIFNIPGLEERVSTLEDDITGLGKINKDICFVGMSIWWYDGKTLAPGVGGGVTAVGYQTILAQQFGFGTKRNYCYSGYSLGATDSEDTSSIALNKIGGLVGGNGDLWTLDTITNDFKRNILIGTISDYNNNTGATTYYGALRIFADKVVSQSGQGAIVVVSNGCRRNNSGYTSTSANANGNTMLDFEYAIAQVAMLNGWYYVDQYRCELTDDIVMLATIDGLHLNNFGYRLAVKPWIEQFNIIAKTL